MPNTTVNCPLPSYMIGQHAYAFSQKTPSKKADIPLRFMKFRLLLQTSCSYSVTLPNLCIVVVYTVEFQKCGLPHAHIVLWLAAADKLLTTDDIDNVTSAEIPDKMADPVLYSCLRSQTRWQIRCYIAVSQFMMHGPCGVANPKCPCMSNGQFTKHYPKHFSDTTVVDGDGYALYRRDTKATVEYNAI